MGTENVVQQLEEAGRLAIVGRILFRGLQRLRAKEARGKLTIVADGQSRKGRRHPERREREVPR
jgi:hypothetical protein